MLSRYPSSPQLMMITLPHEPDIIRLTNRMLLCVESTPLEQAQKMQVVTTLMNYVIYFVLDDYQHERSVSVMLKEQETDPGDEMIRLLNSMSETDAGLFRSMFTNGLFEVMGTDVAFEFGVKLILLAKSPQVLTDPIREKDQKLEQHLPPVLDTPCPFLGDIYGDQIEHFQ